MSQRPVLALTGLMATSNRPDLEAAITTDWDIRTWKLGDSDDALIALLADADAVVPGVDALTTGSFFKALKGSPRLRLLQIPFAGTDWLTPDFLPPQAVAASCSGHEIPMAEFALAACLEWEIRFRLLDADFRQGSWTYTGTSKEDIAYHGEVHGKTLGIVGYGGIGEELAIRAKAFGLRVMALKRSPLETLPDAVDWLGVTSNDPGALDTLLRESDYIVLACDLNDETRGLVGEREFAAMKPNAVIVNIARGDVIQEEPLYNALHDRKIAGAVIDAWYRYPLRGKPPGTVTDDPWPSRFPFQNLANLVMTPHCSAHTRGADARRFQSIGRNLDRFARNEPLHHIAVKGRASV